jgi:hypothetical protein
MTNAFLLRICKDESSRFAGRKATDIFFEVPTPNKPNRIVSYTETVCAIRVCSCLREESNVLGKTSFGGRYDR